MDYEYMVVVAPQRLAQEIRDSAIVTALDYITTTSVSVTIYFKAVLSEGDEAILDALIDAHEPTELQDSQRVELTLSQATAKTIYTEFYQSSLAVDKNGTDQSLSGNDWTEITASRKLWDFGGDYNLSNNNFTIPYDGVYSFDSQISMTNLVNVTEIELAIFKRGSPDDYWFIIDRKLIPTGATSIQLSGATMFDFYTDEEYCLKIKLYGTSPSADISGSDDFTAWGFNLHRPLVGP